MLSSTRPQRAEGEAQTSLTGGGVGGPGEYDYHLSLMKEVLQAINDIQVRGSPWSDQVIIL